jgi:haloalkane dehalogenase
VSDERHAAARGALAQIRELYPFEPRFAVHGAVAQHYVDEGPRDAEVLLCVHGNPTWSFYWRELVRSVRERYRVIAPDHVGCGLSDKPQDYAYTLERHVQNLVALVDALEVERLTLVLHDWGGAIGMGLARRRPERVARIVVQNTAAFRAKHIPWRIALCRVPVLGRIAVRGLNAFTRAALDMAVEVPLSAEVRRGYLLPHDSWAHRIADIAFVEDIPMRAAHPSWTELVATEGALERFRELPALILWGERDWCFTPAFRRRWQELWPQAEVRRFEEAGHWLMEDAGDEAIQAIESFLAAHPLP